MLSGLDRATMRSKASRCRILLSESRRYLAYGTYRTIFQFEPGGAGDGEKNLYDCGVKLRACAAVDFVAGVLDRKSAAIRTVGNHRVQRVGNGENSRPQGNVL